MSANALFPALAAASITVREVRHSHDVVVGGYYPDQRITPRQNARQYDSSILQDYGTRPEITFLEIAMAAVDRTVSAQEVIELARRLPVFQAPPVDRSLPADRNTTSEGRTRQQPPISVASVTPVWAPSYTEMRIVTESNRAAMNHYYSWDSSPHMPTLVPLDWGIEFELNQNESGRGGVWPFCGVGNGLDFRATHQGIVWSVYNSGFSTANLGVYFDGNILGDSCSRLARTMGLGYPRVIPDVNLFAIEFIVRSSRGIQASSVISVSFQTVSNDCPGAPNTDCMGINTGKTWPGPGPQTGLALNRSRGWGTPLCFSFVSGFASPSRFTC